MFSEAALVNPGFSVAPAWLHLQQMALATARFSHSAVDRCVYCIVRLGVYLKHGQSAILAVTRAHHDFQVGLWVALELWTK